MSKRIDSPSTKWAGYVVLRDPLTYEQVNALNEAQDKAAELKPSTLLSQKDETGKITVQMNWVSDMDHLRIEAICKCVEEWHLENIPADVTPQTFPMSPRKPRQELVSWIWDEIQKIYEGETEVPNES